MTDETTVTTPDDVDAPASEELQDAEIDETEVEDTDDSEDSQTDETDAEGEPADEVEEPSAEQRKIAELSFKLREEKRQRARMMRLLEQQHTQAAPAEAPKPPKLEDFDSIDDYVNAAVDFKMKAGLPSAPEPPDNSADFAEFEVAREDMIANGVAKHPDFMDVALSEDLDLTLAMANALIEIDDTDLQVDTAYYLGKNPKEASRISRLSPVRQIAEIAKISDKITAKKAKPVKQPSKAPKPIKPVGGNKTTSGQINPDDDMATFIRKRNKQLGRV